MDTPYQNPLAIRAKKLMTEAFFDLLHETRSDKIKITQLCKRAGVARRTFYTHFDKVEDIPRKYLTDQWLIVFEEQLHTCIKMDLSPEMFNDSMTFHMFDYWGNQAECVALLDEAGFGAIFYDAA